MLVRELPPLRHSISVDTPSGRHYRWGADDPNPSNVPSGLRWSDTMPGGFESCDLTLPRKPSVDYSDLERLSTLQVHDATGGVVGEYRLERTPRTSGDQFAVSPGLVGWQAALEDDKSASMVYIGRDMSQWAEPSTTRRLADDTASFTVTDPSVDQDETTGMPQLRLEINGAWVAPQFPIVEAWYDGGPGLIDGFYFTPSYSAQVNTALPDTNWNLEAGLANDSAAAGAFDISADQFATTAEVVFAPATPRRYAFLLWHYINTPAGGDGYSYQAWLKSVVVVGNHQATTYPSVNGGRAMLASDIVAHAVGRWAPELAFTIGANGSIAPSQFLVEHAAFTDPTTASEIVRQASRFELPFWGVWENRTFHWDASRTPRKRWRARVAPAQLEETGPQVDRLWESVIVSFQDVDGTTRTVGPPGSGADVEDAALKDADPENPANKLGITRRDLLSMGTATTAEATQVGRIFLEQAKLLDSSGRATLTGYVTDEHGVRFPFSAPRAGDDIAFIDASLPVPRRIVRSDKDYGAKTCSLDLDSPPEALDALLERLSVNLVRLGL